MEVVQAVDQSCLRLVSQLDDAISQNCDALAEKRRLQLDLLKNLSRLKLDFAKGGTSVQTCALVKKTLFVGKALSKCCRIMSKRTYDLVRVDWCALGTDRTKLLTLHCEVTASRVENDCYYGEQFTRHG